MSFPFGPDQKEVFLVGFGAKFQVSNSLLFLALSEFSTLHFPQGLLQEEQSLGTFTIKAAFGLSGLHTGISS